jgi:axial budding pattern protein 2
MVALYLLAAALVAPILAGSVSVQIPVEDQLSLIARVNQPYRWTISSKTFLTSNGPLIYSISRLPKWLIFDPATLSFQGIPGPKDQGHLELEITATDATKSSASSIFTISVSSRSPPTLHKPISKQLYTSNPSLSSVFLPSPHSAMLSSGNPVLRIPPGWSFSVGFDGSTYQTTSSLFYDARLADGSPLPSGSGLTQTP